MVYISINKKRRTLYLVMCTDEKYIVVLMEKEMIADWSDLPSDLLESVILKLDFIDIPRFSLVCSSWHSVSKSHLLPPHLMLLPKVKRPLRPPLNSTIEYTDEYSEEFQKNRVERLRFWCPNDTKSIHSLAVGKRYFDRLLDRNSSAVGSSHGWLVVSDQDHNSGNFLFNPYSGSDIELPKMSTLPKAYPSITSHRHERKGGTVDTPRGTPPEPGIKKAILTGDPCGGRNYKVVVIHGLMQKLAYCRRGDTTWTSLTWGSHSDIFLDVACYDNKLYAIALEEGTSFPIKICQWDLTDENPRRTSQIVVPSSPTELDDLMKTLGVIESNLQFYLVPTLEETFFVVRLLGTREQARGVVFDLIDLDLTFDGDMTRAFQVFKVDFDGDEKLVKVESLADQSMFLGRTHSMMVSARGHELGLKENSIYFTDFEDRCFYLNHSDSGHDTGIYSLTERSIMRFDLTQYRPVPLWILPGNKLSLL